MTRDGIEATLDAWRRGEISGPIALMRLVLGGMQPEDVVAVLQAKADRPPISELAALAQGRMAALSGLAAVVRAGAGHGAGTGLDATRAMFDRLVAVSPEAAVAAYSLGDPALLEAATAEVVAWLDGLGLLADAPRVLDLGCGIGRIAAAMAPRARSVLGLDIAPAMVATARARCAGLSGLRFETCSGRDLRDLPDGGFDLVLAADVFPYLVQDGPALVSTMLAEAGRVLAPGGHLAILNLSYRGLEVDRAELPILAGGSGLILAREDVRPFRIWDAAAFLLRKQASGGGTATSAPPRSQTSRLPRTAPPPRSS